MSKTNTYTALPKTDPVWKYENDQWKNINQTTEEDLEEGEVLTDNEMPPLVYDSENERIESKSQDEYRELKETWENQESLKGQLNYMNYLMSSWYSHAKNLEREVSRKENVIRHKDSKATRLIGIIREKNRENDELHQRVLELEGSLEMIQKVLNGSKTVVHQNLPSNRTFLDIVSESINKLHLAYKAIVLIESKDFKNLTDFEEFLREVQPEFIKTASKFVKTLNFEDPNSKKHVIGELKNFMGYKYQISKYEIDFSDGWYETFEDFMNTTLPTHYEDSCKDYDGW